MQSRKNIWATTHDIDNQYTQAVADFISALRYEDIPAEVLHRIKLLMLDSFGCALYGVKLEWAQASRPQTRARKTPKNGSFPAFPALQDDRRQLSFTLDDWTVGI